MPNEALARAIELRGGQSALAEAIGVRQSHVWFWLKKAARGVPAEHCQAIERETGVSKHELRPDIFGSPAPSEQAGAL